MIRHKRQGQNRTWQAWMSAMPLALVPLPALAYLDPTTGSMIISAIVGLFASLVLAIRTYWYRIKKFFRRGTEVSESDDTLS